MSLKIQIALLFTGIAALTALLITQDPEGIREIVFGNPWFLTGALGLVSAIMQESKNKNIVGLGGLLMVVTWILFAWFGFKLIGQFLNDYNIKIVTKWGNK